jgi:quercetin dioxygenase-like cupin family protein
MIKIRSILLTVVVLTTLTGINMAQNLENNYTVYNFKAKINDGHPIEKNLLLKGENNIVANVTLRDNKSMGVHTEKNAFWVITTAGSGKLILGDNEKTIELKPGVMVTVKPGIPHDVLADPNLSILVVKFLDGKTVENQHGHNKE